MRIKVGKAHFAEIDDSDFSIIENYAWYPFFAGNTVYARAYVRGTQVKRKHRKTVLMHVLILGKKEGFQIDHINCNGLDNRKQNMRFCTASQNCMNRTRLVRNGVFKGVHKQKKQKNWQAYIHINKKQVHLGMFPTEIYAALAHDEAARKYFGEFARPNFPVNPKLLAG